jgi:hypothetical protein
MTDRHEQSARRDGDDLRALQGDATDEGPAAASASATQDACRSQRNSCQSQLNARTRRQRARERQAERRRRREAGLVVLQVEVDEADLAAALLRSGIGDGMTDNRTAQQAGLQRLVNAILAVARHA